MDKKITINAEEIRQLEDRLREINRIPFDDIEWYENGSKIECDDIVKDHWRFVGMVNSDFIDTEFYKEDPADLVDT